MIQQMDEKYASCLQDESRLRGTAESISFPTGREELVETVRSCIASGTCITVQGSRTGITGSAVPCGGHILNVSSMNRALCMWQDGDGDLLLEVEPGYTLDQLHRDLHAGGSFPEEMWEPVFAGGFFWPPDPGETTATMGGLAATDAHGPGSFRYGSVGRYVEAVQAILPDGSLHHISRGQYVSRQGTLLLPNGDAVSAPEAFDAIGLFVGGEGLFGAMASVTLRLMPAPAELWVICFFFETEEQSAGFIDRATGCASNSLAALDFLDSRSLELVQSLKAMASRLQTLPDLPEHLTSAVYVELHGESTLVEADADALMTIAEECGGDPDCSWAVSGQMEADRLRGFRHAIPEAIHARLDQLRGTFPHLTKTATDLRVPGVSFSEALWRCRTDLAESGLDAVLYAHGCDNRFHINLLPETPGQQETARHLLTRWFSDFSLTAGTHHLIPGGIGRLKRDVLAQTSPELVAQIRRIKHQLDPRWLWNPGNVLAPAKEA